MKVFFNAAGGYAKDEDLCSFLDWWWCFVEPNGIGIGLKVKNGKTVLKKHE